MDRLQVKLAELARAAAPLAIVGLWSYLAAAILSEIVPA